MKISEALSKTDGTDRKQLKGKGGGGGGKSGSQKERTPREDDQRLISRDYVNLLAVIGEGEIQGFPNPNAPLQSVFLDETPVQNPDGTANFEGFELQFRYGTPDQTAIPGFSNIERENLVDATVRQDTPIVRAITDLDTDAVRVRIVTPQLQRIDEDDGDVKATRVDFAIDVSTNGGPFVNRITDAFFDRTSGGFTRSYQIQLPSGGPWNIRVRRLTEDSDTVRVSDLIQFASFTTIIYSQESYPNTALLGGRFFANQFSSVPSVELDLLGIKMLVPNNYNGFNRTYSGLFNGGLKLEYTNNPVWFLYNLLINELYGLGIADEVIDIFSFYEAGQYCDELVSDGLGGLEHRYSFDAYIQNSDDAYKLMSSVAASFRGQVYYAKGSIYLSIDRPKNPVQIYSPENVIVEYDDSGQMTQPPFQYESSDLTTRYNAALITWSDPQERYKAKVEPVQDDASIEKIGYRPTDITAFGTTSRSEAHRKGRWELYTSLFQTETVTFTAGEDSIQVRPGQVIKIQDSYRQKGTRRAGRILESNNGFVKFDRPIPLDRTPHNFFFIDPATATLVKEVLTPDFEGETDEIIFSTLIPAQYTMFTVEKQVDENQSLWEVVSIKESGGNYEISGVQYDPLKYTFVENYNYANQNQLIQNVPVPDPPINLDFTESKYVSTNGSGVKARITLVWGMRNHIGVTGYEIQYRDVNNNFWKNAFSEVTSAELLDFIPGRYDFRVRARNLTGFVTNWTTIFNVEVLGIGDTPSDLTGLRLTKLDQNTGYFSWEPINQNTDLDVIIGGKIVVKHNRSPFESQAEWGNSIKVKEIPAQDTSFSVALREGTYLFRVVDSSGNESTGVSKITTRTTPVARNETYTRTTDPEPDKTDNFNIIGTTFEDGIGQSGDFSSSVDGTIQVSALNYIDYAPDFDSIPDLDNYNPELASTIASDAWIWLENENPISSVTNRNEEAEVKISADVDARIIKLGLNIDDVADFDSLTASFFDDSAPQEGVEAELWIKYFDVNQQSIKVEPFENPGIYTCFDYAIGLRAKVENPDAANTLRVSKFATSYEFEQRTESGTFTGNTGGADFQFRFAFKPSVIFQIEDSVGHYVQVSANRSEFSAVIRDATGNLDTKTVTWTATGYGKVLRDA